MRNQKREYDVYIHSGILFSLQKEGKLLAKTWTNLGSIILCEISQAIRMLSSLTCMDSQTLELIYREKDGYHGPGGRGLAELLVRGCRNSVKISSDL